MIIVQQKGWTLIGTANIQTRHLPNTSQMIQYLANLLSKMYYLTYQSDMCCVKNW